MLDPTQAMPMMAGEHTSPHIELPHIKLEHIGDSGKIMLWIVFVVMLASSAGFSLMAWSLPLSKRLFHTVTTLITITAAISYYAMATGHAVDYNHAAHKGGHSTNAGEEVYRQVFWARYVDWAITTPLLLIDLGLLAGLSGGHLFMAIFADITMVLTGLFAAYPNTASQKWGWYAIACLAYLVVVWHLVVNGRRVALSKSQRVKNLYGSLAVFTIALWTAYPVIWGIADGGRILNVDAEVIAYGILDILAKPVFGFWLLYAHGSTEENVEVGGFWSNSLTSEGAVRLEDDDGA